MDYSPTLDDLFGPLSDLDPDFEEDILGGSDQWSHVDPNTSHPESATSQGAERSVGEQTMSPRGDVEQHAEPSSGSKRTVRDWDLVEFQPDPDSQFWVPHLGRARLQELPKQPWESSPINKVFDMSFLQPPNILWWALQMR